MAKSSREARSPRAEQRPRWQPDPKDGTLDGLLSHLLEDSSGREQRRLRLRLLAQDLVGNRVAILQGYLAMLNDGTLSDPEPIFPILLGHAHDLVLAIEELIRSEEEGGVLPHEHEH